MLKGVYVTLLVGPTVPVPVPQVVVDALTGVQVTVAAGQRSGFQLTFTLSNQSPLQTAFLLMAGQVPLLRTIIILTINSIPNVLMDGVITHTEVTPGGKPGQSTLTVTGEDLTKVMDLQDFSGLPYPAMPAEVRVALIIAKYAMFGIIPLVIPSLFIDIPIPVDRIPTHQGSDLKYVEQLASQVGYVFYIEPGPLPGTNTAYWGPEIKFGVPQPALNFDMDAYTNVEALSFSYKSTEYSIPIVFIQNQLTHVPIPIPIPPINPLQPPLGAIPPLPTSLTILKDTAKLSPMAAISRGLKVAGQAQDAVSGTGTLDALHYGRLLQARKLVGVRGVGMAFDGLYYVKAVTTTLKRNELKQTFNLSRNGLVSITPVVPT
ncbi:MAG: hypothetical protein DMF72_20480 [Acidobacteria bacterium]|nr:MAG: hypothetical protein DMF72_20480 [Acidobacteriota bacterium]